MYQRNSRLEFFMLLVALKSGVAHRGLGNAALTITFVAFAATLATGLAAAEAVVSRIAYFDKLFSDHSI